MNGRRARIEALFLEASEQPAAGCVAFLEHACGDDAELRREVETMLAASAGASGRIRHAIGREVVALTSEEPGMRLGSYRLSEKLGQGGMGAVYLAVRDDDQYRSEVAVKLLPRGLETDAAVARFRDERQILAALDHPGIVRLLDGGSTADGAPYLVMEYVRGGVPITAWADERELGVRARVELFREVCAAVAYAHQNLVVHRDLKPANILVTPSGRSKLLDFGIAKLLDDSPAARAARTGTGAQLLTPGYASPEQVRGQPVSTATDIYSLGVILYELLAGVKAVRADADGLAVLTEILERDPPRPSAVAPAARRRALVGDLDNIVRKAMRKEPAQRYASVEQLAADVGRYLDGLPVHARGGSWGYRAGKFLRRNRVLVAASAVVVVTLSAASVISVRAARRADAEARVAQRRFAETRRLANSLLIDVDAKIRDLEGATGARELIVSRALEYLDGLAGDVIDDPALARELATAYMKIGDIQGNVLGPNLGRPQDGIESYRKAEQILSRIPGIDDATRLARAQVGFGLGALYWTQNDIAAARASLEQAMAIAETVPRGPGFEFRPIVQGCAQLTQLEINAAEWELGDALAPRCRELDEEWLRVAPSPEARYFFAVVLEAIAYVDLDDGNPRGAVDAYLEAGQELDALVAAYPENHAYRRERFYALVMLATGASGLGDSVRWRPSLGDLAAAEDALRRAVEIIEVEAAKDPRDVQGSQDLATALSGLGAVVGVRDPAQGAALLQRAAALYEGLPPAARGSGYSLQNEWYTHCALAPMLAQGGRRAEALAASRQGLAIVEQLVMEAGASETKRIHRAECRYDAARAWRALGEPATAIAVLALLLPDLEGFIATRPHEMMSRIGLVESLELLAELRPAERCPRLGQALDAWRSWVGVPTEYTRSQELRLRGELAGCPAR